MFEKAVEKYETKNNNNQPATNTTKLKTVKQIS
jgi:hypothetical protein